MSGQAGSRSYYGQRGKIGLMLPSMNNTLDPELARTCPPGVSCHSTRLLLAGGATADSFDAMAGQVERGARELEAAEVDVVAYCCASGSSIGEGTGVSSTIERLCGVPAFTAMEAVVRALGVFGARRLAVVTPYIESVNALERQYLEARGLEVLAMAGLGLGHTQAERRAIGHQPPERAYQLALATDLPEAEALFVSCTNLATLELVDRLEAALGKPVVSSNQALLWNALRTIGLPDRVPGWGSLLRDY